MKHILIFVTVLTISSTSWGNPLTLETVVTEVVKNHPAIVQATADASAAKSNKHKEAWLPDPNFELKFQEVPLADKNPNNANITMYSISQEIPFPTTLVTQSKALDASFQAKKVMISGTERLKIFEAKKTFFELVAKQHQLQNQESILKNYQSIIATAEKSYATGNSPDMKEKSMSTYSDILMAKMKKAEIETQIDNLHHQMHAGEATLNLMMGRDPDLNIDSLAAPSLKHLLVDDEIVKQKFENQNADLISTRWMTKKSSTEVSLAKQKLIPTLAPTFSYDDRKTMGNAYDFSVNLNIPLWLNRNKAEIDEAKANFKSQSAAEQSQKIDAESKLYYLIHHAKEHYKIVTRYRDEIIPLAQSSVKVATQSFEGGLISSSNVLQKIINANEAQQTYWDMWMDYQVEYSQLEQMVGEEL